MESKSLKKNFLDTATWKKGLLILLFTLFYGIAEIMVTAVVLFQFLFVLFTGGKNKRLLEFGKNLSIYVYQVMLFFTYNSEEKPFPFGEWPADESSSRGTE